MPSVAPTGSGSRTLLLNSTYEPLRVISWQRAVTMVYVGKVEVLKTYESVLRSMTTRLQTPAVVRLMTFVRRHRVRISFSRRNVFLRDGFLCQYCGVSLPASELTTDHVVPRSHGGGTTWDNVVTACSPCNLRKGGRTPKQARMILNRRPSRPSRLPSLALRLRQESAPALWHEFLATGSTVEAAS
ncbi:MAG: hypothetical protein Tsb0020_28520 [Haliangiales bacterium]